MERKFKIISIIFILFFMRFGISEKHFKTPVFWGQILPQGWGFFTINPYYSNLNHYIYNREFEYIDLSSSSYKLIYGLKRDNRRKSLAFNHVFKDPVLWRKHIKFNDSTFNYEEGKIIDFKNSDSNLDKGLYLTTKNEILNINNTNKPRKAIFYYRIK